MNKFILALAVTAMLAAAAPAESVNTLDAKSVIGQVTEISPQSVLVQEGKNTQTIPRSEVADIALGEGQDVMTHTSSPVVVTASGAKLAVADVEVSSAKLTFSNVLVGGKTLDLSAVSQLYFPSANRNLNDIDKIAAGLKIPEKAADFLILQRKAGDFMVLDGVLKEINKDNIIFTWKGDDRRIARTSVAELRLGGTKAVVGGVTGVLRGVGEGSRVPFTSLALKGGEFKVSAPTWVNSRSGGARSPQSSSSPTAW